MMKRAMTIAIGCVAIASICGCKNIERSMVFTTATTLGAEVAFKPESEAPLSLVIGYKRAELLFDPIMEDAGHCGKFKIKDQPHSVMAKLLGEIKTTGKTGGSNGPEAAGAVSVAQWFASGKAAEILAENGGAAALTNKPEEVAAAMNSFGGSLTASELVVIPYMLDAIGATLSDLSTDPRAATLLADLDKVADDLNVPVTWDFVEYTLNTNVNPNVLSIRPNPTIRVTHDRIGFQAYLQRLQSSVAALEKANSMLSATPPQQVDLTALGGMTVAQLKLEAQGQLSKLKAMARGMASSKRIKEAAMYVFERLSK